MSEPKELPEPVYLIRWEHGWADEGVFTDRDEAESFRFDTEAIEPMVRESRLTAMTAERDEARRKFASLIRFVMEKRREHVAAADALLAQPEDPRGKETFRALMKAGFVASLNDVLLAAGEPLFPEANIPGAADIENVAEDRS